MALTKAEDIQLGRLLRQLCADGFLDLAKELAKLTDEELSDRLKRLKALELHIAGEKA